MSPLDCTATALGTLSPLVTNDAVVVPISVPIGVYRTRPNTEPALGMLIPATTARSPLDSSTAANAARAPAGPNSFAAGCSKRPQIPDLFIFDISDCS